MNKKGYLLIVLVCTVVLLFMVFSVQEEAQELTAAQETPVTPPRSPYEASISGVGVVEPSSENILIGTPLNRIVDKILVTSGKKIRKGDILFQLDSRDLQSELKIQKVAYENAQARYSKLRSLPRPEDLTAGEAALKSAQISSEQAKSQYQMILGLQDKRALSQQEINRRRFNFQMAQAKEEEAKANLEKIQAGAWKPDLDIAQNEVDQAKANIDKIKTEIERTIIRSPINGTVLQIKIHEGEFPPHDKPSMIVGNTNELHVRVNINQWDAPYFRSNAPAVAFLQGEARIEIPLKFVRIEPYLVSKQNITNEITEKLDTRVLQVIYEFKNASQLPIYVGQQVDVFIKAEFPR